MYSVSALKAIIPTANLEKVKRIFSILCDDINSYKPNDINPVLILISRRLISLSCSYLRKE
jgi:hypothetical protein